MQYKAGKNVAQDILEITNTLFYNIIFPHIFKIIKFISVLSLILNQFVNVRFDTNQPSRKRNEQ